MNIITNPIFMTKYRDYDNKKLNRMYYPNLMPLQKDTISFGAMKKHQFEGFDRIVINRFQIDMNKINTEEDFKNLRDRKLEKYINNYDKNASMTDWLNFCLNENNSVSPSASLLIIESMVLKLNRGDNLPEFNEQIAFSALSKMEELVKSNPKISVNFEKIYTSKSIKNDIDELTGNRGNNTCWIIISSKKNDPENFNNNVKKLKNLSHHNWCTKSSLNKAEEFLSKGDFHIYYENGEPKLGVRFDNDEIQEIQGEKNDSKIPYKYIEITREHTKNYKKNDKTQKEFEFALKVEKAIKEFKQKLGKPVEKATSEELFRALNMFHKRDEKDGMIILKSYNQPSDIFTWEDLGVDENKIFKDIKRIEGNAVFGESKLNSLGQLQSIGGNAHFQKSKINSLGDLREIQGSAYFVNSQIRTLNKLNIIGDEAYFCDSPVVDLGELQAIGGDANFENSMIKSINNLKAIGGDADFGYSEISSLGDLEAIGGSAFFRASDIKSLDHLKIIGRNADFRGSKLISTGNLEKIGGNADFRECYISNFGKIKNIGGYVFYNEFMKLSNQFKQKEEITPLFADIIRLS